MDLSGCFAPSRKSPVGSRKSLSGTIIGHSLHPPSGYIINKPRSESDLICAADFAFRLPTDDFRLVERQLDKYTICIRVFCHLQSGKIERLTTSDLIQAAQQRGGVIRRNAPPVFGAHGGGQRGRRLQLAEFRDAQRHAAAFFGIGLPHQPVSASLRV